MPTGIKLFTVIMNATYKQKSSYSTPDLVPAQDSQKKPKQGQP